MVMDPHTIDKTLMAVSIFWEKMLELRVGEKVTLEMIAYIKLISYEAMEQ